MRVSCKCTSVASVKMCLGEVPYKCTNNTVRMLRNSIVCMYTVNVIYQTFQNNNVTFCFFNYKLCLYFIENKTYRNHVF